MIGEPADTQMAFIWNLKHFADAVSDCTNYPIYVNKTRCLRSEAKARKHARRLMALAHLSPHDADSRAAFKDLLGG